MTVVHLARAGLYLKHGRVDDLRDERDRLEWLAGRLPVPRVVEYAERRDGGYLVTTEIAGLTAEAAIAAEGPERAVSAVGAALRRAHRVPEAGCPFDMRLDVTLGLAAERARGGRVRVDLLDPERAGRSVDSLLDELERTRPAEPELAFTHGDACLDNVILSGGTLAGFIDVGRAGVSDPYRDLALAARDVERKAGAAWLPALWRAYGLAAPDERRLEYYRLLDELF